MMNDRIRKILIEEIGCTESDVECMSCREIFEEIMQYEGICGYAGKIIHLIEEIYGVFLEKQDGVRSCAAGVLPCVPESQSRERRLYS